jgi:transcription elongation factor GreA-like protein
MIEDVNYFKYIFKKTEKISCAVFYILRHHHNVSATNSVVSDLENTTRIVLDTALKSLTCTETHIRDTIYELRYALIALESKLRIAHVTQHIESKHLEVFLHEIDSVYRAMKKYTEESIKDPLDEMQSQEVYTHTDIRRKGERKNIRTGMPAPQGISVHTVDTQTMYISRRDRIREFLRDKPQATIKDIIQVITDCSEKTIQRELIDMIKDNIVVRDGERRWSKYTLV